jgi:biopolymer transport protein ExbB
MMWIWEFMVKGGLEWMLPIAFLLVLACTLILERSMALFLNYDIKGTSMKFFSRVKSLVKDGRIQDAYQQCLTTSHPLSKVLAAILYNSNNTPDAIDAAASIEIQKVLPGIQKRTSFINMMGNVSTLLGLLGTISGLIASFSSLTTAASAAEKTKLLTEGIAVAMNTTAFGLVVAIPCIIFYSYLTSKEDSIVKKYDEIISEVTYLVVHKPHQKSVVNESTEFREFKEFKKHG